MKNNEIWRPVAGYEGLYEVSDLGRVRSLKHICNSCYGSKSVCNGKILTPCKSSNKYMIVGLSKDGNHCTKSVHGLVAHAFPEICGELFKGCVINHKDENKSNNVATNLEVCTQKYNCNYGTHNARMSTTKSKFSLIQLTLDGKFVKRWGNACIAAKELGIKSYCNIYKAITGERKSCGGFKWQYA